VTDYRIGLFGCANVAVNFFDEMGLRRDAAGRRAPKS
jgi:hypothetical protein